MFTICIRAAVYWQKFHSLALRTLAAVWFCHVLAVFPVCSHALRTVHICATATEHSSGDVSDWATFMTKFQPGCSHICFMDRRSLTHSHINKGHNALFEHIGSTGYHHMVPPAMHAPAVQHTLTYSTACGSSCMPAMHHKRGTHAQFAHTNS